MRMFAVFKFFVYLLPMCFVLFFFPGGGVTDRFLSFRVVNSVCFVFSVNGKD